LFTRTCATTLQLGLEIGIGLAIGGGVAIPTALASDEHPVDDRAMGDGLAEYEAAAALRAADGTAHDDDAPGLVQPLDPMAATCADGPTTIGIDVSKWQGNVDWTRVANAGVKFAFVRVSHGVNTIDQWFESNWEEARAAGIHVGAYQYFEPGQSATQQADILLDMMGPLSPGDLPPVIDVESHGNLSAATVAARVTEWVDRVEAATGTKPIIYTGRFFWQDYVKTDALDDYPLWIAHYTNGCPNLPQQWDDWAFHQYTDKGSTQGVSGPVDTNRFNGDLAALQAFAIGGEQAQPEPEPEPEPLPQGCGVIAPEGTTVVDNGEDCYVLHGPAQWWRQVAGVGIDGDVTWTGTTKSSVNNWAEVNLDFVAAGSYQIEAHIPKPHNTSKQAKYKIQHGGGLATVIANQSTKNGWVNLGTYLFDEGGDQFISLADATGESNSLGRKIVLDAFRITATGGGARDGSGELGGDDIERGDGEASCSVAPRASGWWALALVVLGAVRRRRVG
jgi:MYXO-CTERM domain-containing protein